MKTKTGHTKGPWQLRGSYEFGIRAVFGLGGDVACLNLKNNRMKDEIEANARLIAASPDLLAALDALVDAESEMFGNDIFRPEAQPEHPVQKAWLLARAAIAKA